MHETVTVGSSRERSGIAAPGVVCTLCILVVYAATFLALPHDGFWINDNGCKFIQLQGMIETNYRDFSIPWPGHALDPHYYCDPLPSPFGYLVKGRLYGTFSPVFLLASSLTYRLFGFAGLYVLPLLSALLILPALWRLTALLTAPGTARRLAQPLALLVVALGTPMWFYSVTFWEHVPAACLATWSIVFWLRYRAGVLQSARSNVNSARSDETRSGSPRWLVSSAVLAAGAVYFRDELYLFGAILALLIVQRGQPRWRDLLRFAGVFVVSLLPLWLFQWLALGHPTGHHLYSVNPLDAGLTRHLLDRGAVLQSLLLNAHESLWISVAVALPFLLLAITRPRLPDRVFRHAVVVLGGIALVGGAAVMAGHLTADRPIWWLRRANGLFAASPILILTFVGRKSNVRTDEPNPVEHARKEAFRTLGLTIVLFVLLYVVLVPKRHSSGVHWGCRYLLPLFPLMGVMASVTLAEWWTRFRRGQPIGTALLALTLALSVSAQCYSLTLLRARKRFSAELNRRVLEHKEEIILASGWFIPQELARVFYKKKIFLPFSQRLEARLLRGLRRAGYHDALRVAFPPARDAVEVGSEIVDDGALNFLSVELRPFDFGK